MTTRADIVAAALAWEGTRYKHQGRDRYGLDCVGLIIKVAHDCGITDYDTVNYPRRPNAHDFLREMKGNLTRKLKRDTRPGDVLMFRSRGIPCHVGIMVDEDRFIHAYAPHKAVTVDPLALHADKLVCAWEYQGVVD